jgi:hypothetical protein
MSLFLAGVKVRPIDTRHPWRELHRECLVEGTYLSRRTNKETKQKRVVLALQVEGFSRLVYQWAADFEVVEADQGDSAIG